jgi:putative transposase
MFPVYRRKSIRLSGFDYSSTGSYFVTICSRGHSHIFGKILNAKIVLSEAGSVSERCWNEIPEHYPGVCVEVHQVMPNHIHGIVQIKKSNKAMPSNGQPCGIDRNTLVYKRVFGHPQPGTLSTIVGSYKSAVTKELHDLGLFPGRSIWQTRFHDHIIRDARSHFLIEWYIRLNPFIWHLDHYNSSRTACSKGDFKRMLKNYFGVTEFEAEWIWSFFLKEPSI